MTEREAVPPLTEEEITGISFFWFENEWVLCEMKDARKDIARLLATIKTDRERIAGLQRKSDQHEAERDNFLHRAESAEARVKDLESALQAAEEALVRISYIESHDARGQLEYARSITQAALDRIRVERGERAPSRRWEGGSVSESKFTEPPWKRRTASTRGTRTRRRARKIGGDYES